VEADRVIQSHVLWAMGAGLIPFPLFDIAAVTGVQMDMLNQLARIYKVDYTAEMGKTFAGALTGSLFARIGASMIKVIPGIGTVIGGLSMSVMSGASTFAVGNVARSYFASGVSLNDVDLDTARRQYETEYERGKREAKDLEARAKSKEYKATLEDLDQAHGLHEKGALSDEEYEDLKRRLLERLQ
jgi:uncharacterized protein (DUF697 family)